MRRRVLGALYFFMEFSAHVQAGNSISLFRGVDGSVWSCGRNLHGQLGCGHTQDLNFFERIDGLENIVQVSCSWMHVLCLDMDGDVWSFGWNVDGQLGHGDKKNRLSPVKVPNLPKITQVAAGGKHSLCLDSDGFVWGCGSNYDQQLGSSQPYIPGTSEFINLGLENVRGVHAGYVHSVIQLTNGEIYGIGSTFHGQLGQGNRYQVSPPKVIPFSGKISTIFIGSHSTIIIDKHNLVWVTGKNECSQLSVEPNDVLKFVQLPEFTTKIQSASCGHSHSFFLDSDGCCWGVGQNTDGQLGTKDRKQRKVPTKLPFEKKVISVSCGLFHTVMIDEDEQIWTFGANTYGQLGTGDQVSSTEPIPQQRRNQKSAKK